MLRRNPITRVPLVVLAVSALMVLVPSSPAVHAADSEAGPTTVGQVYTDTTVVDRNSRPDASGGPRAVTRKSGGSVCEGDEKIEGGVEGGNHVYNAPAGESITSVCIKAGRVSFQALCGADDDGPAGCYDVSWTLGDAGCCTAVEIGGGGTSNTCKAISHSAVTFGGPPCDGCVPEPEQCSNGTDDDCDGLVDCNDPDCAEDPSCNQCVPVPEVCGGDEDEDCDGLVDCNDPDCAEDPSCNQCVPVTEVCGGDEDEDCDGLVDCNDPDCAQDPSCNQCVPVPEVCEGDEDEDCDGLVDCNDPDCGEYPGCNECVPVAEVCEGDVDDDCDGLIDCNDPDCGEHPSCTN